MDDEIFEEIEQANLYDNDLLEIVNNLNPVRKKYTVRPRVNHFDNLDDNEFFVRFRLSKFIVLQILAQIEYRLSHRTQRNFDRAVKPLDQLLITLRFCATGSFYITMGDFGHIHKSTTGKIIDKVITALCSLRPAYIALPETDDVKNTTMLDFYRIASFPKVIGAIDCTHIKIQSPGGQHAELFRNRKGWFSLNVQAICDANYQILDLVARWPGATHDSHIFNNSAVMMRFETQQFRNCVLLGDSGYPLRQYLLTPFLNPIGEYENLYNESQIRTRNVIERTFGILKRRFPILSLGLRCHIPLAQKIIIACGILHNIACKQATNLRDAEFAILNAEEIDGDEENDDENNQLNNEDDDNESSDDEDARANAVEYFRNLLNTGQN